MAPEDRPDAGAPEAASAVDAVALYRALSAAADLDSLHDLVVRHGAEVLDLPFPYLVVAARNRFRDRLRRQDREVPSDPTGLPEGPSRSTWDPLEVAVAHDELRRTLEALASMDDRDVLVVWLAAAGFSDEEIIDRWDELRFSPHHPTPAAIRKRRERARADLKGRRAADEG